MNNDNYASLDILSIDYDKKLPIEHFPSRLHAFIFRCWDKIPALKMAEVTDTTEENITEIAYAMSLPKQNIEADWLEIGYITIIRSLWWIMPYDQLLELLGWDEERLGFVLKEDDYLGSKLGRYKPYCTRIVYEERDSKVKLAEKRISDVMKNHIRIYDSEITTKPFEFFKKANSENKPCENNKKFPVELNEKWCWCSSTDEISAYCDMFFNEFNTKWGIKINRADNKKENVIKLLVDNTYEDEFHKVEITKKEITISAGNTTGLIRGLNHILGLAYSAGGAFFEEKIYNRTPKMKLRMIYSYCSLFTNLLENDKFIGFSDELLYEYARCGINGIWIQCVLRNITEFPFEPSYSKGWEVRLSNLKKLVNKLKRFGIKLYLYTNEPRALPDKFFEKYPDIQGAHNIGYPVCDGLSSLCTSTEIVKKYLSDSITRLCSEIPDIGGFIMITRSENMTNCYSHATPDTITCERCKELGPVKVITDVIKTINDAAKSVNPDIKVIAWTWAWSWEEFGEEYPHECIANLPEDVIVMCTSEEKKDYSIGGVKGKVSDYTMSIVPPGEYSKGLWQTARKTNHSIAAKVQVNNTWECSSVPYIPVHKNIVEHLNNLYNENVENVMLSWTLGGYPSENIELLSEAFFIENNEEVNTYDKYNSYIERKYKEKAPVIKEASDVFCEAFSEFPFHIGTLYSGPQNGGISNPLYIKPTGLKSTMTCYAYDCLEHWRSIYPREIFSEQFKKLSIKWHKGITLLKENGIDCQFSDIAKACDIIFSSSYNQINFIIIRDEYLKNEDISLKEELKNIAEKEIVLAENMYKLMIKNPCIGYEAANHYYYDRAMLAEKIISTDYVINEYLR